MKRKSRLYFIVAIFIIVLQACNLPGTPQGTEPPASPTAEQQPTSEQPPAVQHQTIPVSAPDARPYPDVTSSSTAPEKRAPYGDSYAFNRLERPFLQDMTYIPDLDIASLAISEDADWYYISIGVVGKNPNNSVGINFGVELDKSLDGFGDYLILAQPPYSEEWTAENVQIYEDTNRDTAGTSASRSDAPFSGNGFDKLIHSLNQNIGDDPDLAWVRINANEYATVQFAIKKSWLGSTFMFGVLADAGLRDISKLDYVDAFTEKEAGSPVRSNSYYPLLALFAVDNTCLQTFGFSSSGFEPKICPEIIQPSIVEEGGPIPTTPGVDYCTSIGSPNPGNCPWGWSDSPYCFCTPG